MTDPADIAPAAANWLAERLDPGAHTGRPEDAGRRIIAKRKARELLAQMWDAGLLARDPRKPGLPEVSDRA